MKLSPRTQEIRKALDKQSLKKLKLTPEEITQLKPVVRGMLIDVLDQRRTQLEFKRWLAVYFIKKGSYQITDKAYAELAPKTKKQSMELTGISSDRKPEERIEGIYCLSNTEVRVAVREKIESLIDEDKAEELYDNGYVTKPKQFTWKDKKIRNAVIKKFIETVVNPKEVTQDSFTRNELTGLLQVYYKNSPYEMLVERGYAYSIREAKQHAKAGTFKTNKIYPWEMNKCPYYENKDVRVAAVNWLVWKTKKDPKDISYDDFHVNGLGGLLVHRYGGSPYRALIEVGYAYSIEESIMHAKTGKFKRKKKYPWQMNACKFYRDKQVRIATVKWLVWKTGKEPVKLTKQDFSSNGVEGLLVAHYNSSPFKAVSEADFVSMEDKKRMKRGGSATLR